MTQGPKPPAQPGRNSDQPDDVTELARELEQEHARRRTTGAPPRVDLSGFETSNTGSNPYFRPQNTSEPTVEVTALRPLSEAVVQPVRMPEPEEGVALEPTDDQALNRAILTKRLPVPSKPDAPTPGYEDVTVNIPEATGSDTAIRKVLPQSKVLKEPGLLLSDEDLENVRRRTSRGLLVPLVRAMAERVTALANARAIVPFDHSYYDLRAVSWGADISESPSLLEAAFLARVSDRPDARAWALGALARKAHQNGGVFHDRAGNDPDTPPSRGCITALRDVALAADLLSPYLTEADKEDLAGILHFNAKRLAAFVNDPSLNLPAGLGETGAMALGLVGLPLMTFERFYADAKRWVDTAEQRAASLLANRVAENGRPAASDLVGLTDLLRYLLPFAAAFKRYYGDDMLMGEGGNLSQLPRWAAHQFGSGRHGLFASSRLSVGDLRGATPIWARLADTYRDGVAQWLLHQISVADAARRAGDEKRATNKLRLELPATPGLDAVLTAVFYDPELTTASPDSVMTPGARLSETRAVVRSDWDPSSPIVTLQAEMATLPYVHVASQGVNLKLFIEPDIFADHGGKRVTGRVRDYIDLGGAAYVNGDFKCDDGSLAQRHLLYLRSEHTALLFDRFDIGDGRTLKKTRLRIEGSDHATAIDRGTLAVRASDGSERSARFTFYSNGFSQGVERGGPGSSPGLSLEFMRGRGDLASIIALGRIEDMPEVRRINAEEKGRVYRTTMGEGAVLFNGWQGGMPQQCGWVWTDALMAFVDRRDDYPGRYVAIKATSVLAYDMEEGIHLGFGAAHPEDPDKPVEFSLVASGPQAVLYLSTRAQVRVAFPGLRKVMVDGIEVDTEGVGKIHMLSRALEPGRHLLEFEHESPGPESSIALPRENQLVGGNAPFQATIGDPIGVDSARLLIDGQYFGATLNGPPWVWKVNTTQLSEGPHESVIEASDVLGHVRRSAPRRFSVDNTAPLVDLREPKDGKKARGVLVFVATAEDDNGVERVQFCIDGKAVGEPVTTPPYSREIDTAVVPDGEHVVTAVAVDAAGNIGTSTGARLILTNNAPPPKIVKLKIKPSVLALGPLEEAHVDVIGIDDEDGEHAIKVQWKRIKGTGVVDKNGTFTAPGIEGACVLEAVVPGTEVKARLNVDVSRAHSKDQIGHYRHSDDPI